MKKGETYAQRKYRTDPKYRKKRRELNRQYQDKLRKENEKKKRKRDPKKLQEYRKRYEKRTHGRKHLKGRYKVQGDIPRVKVFCEMHPGEKLRKMHYVMNQSKKSGIVTTNWFYCRKCDQPYEIELVEVPVYKVKQ